MQSNKESNQKLIERFPFLMPRNRWTGEVPEDYDYSYTELDSMPDGWRKAFGEQMCEDIREELVRAEYLDQYRITQIKETLAVQSGCFVTSSPNTNTYLRELASDVGTLQQRFPLAGSVPTVTLVLAKSVMPRDLFPLRNGSIEAAAK